MEDLVKELTIDMVPDGDNRIIAETIGVENYQWTTPAPHRGGRRQLRHQRPCILLQQERDSH